MGLGQVLVSKLIYRFTQFTKFKFFIIIISLVFVAGFVSSPAFAVNQIIFNNANQFPGGIPYDHAMNMTVSFDTNPPGTSSITVAISSPAGTGCNSIQFNRVGLSNNYVPLGSFVYLTTSTSDCLKPSIKVSSTGSVVTATVNGYSPTVSGTENTRDQNYGTYPPPAGPQPDLTKNLLPCPSGEPPQGTSNDGICDSWKNPPLFSGLKMKWTGPTGEKVEVSMSCATPDPLNPCPDINHKDIYIEVDYYEGHAPSYQALLDLQNKFNQHGIYLHFQIDDKLSGYHQHWTAAPSVGSAGNTQWDNVKKAFFGTACERGLSPCTGHTNQWITDTLTLKRQVFHYMLITHSQSNGASGSAETPGNDIDISLGNFVGGVGSQDDLEGTIMHELGHNLGLKHGGNEDTNCKPNYLSIMSWSRQFSTLFQGGATRPLDYSSEADPNPGTGYLTSSGLTSSISLTNPSTTQHIIRGDSSGAPHDEMNTNLNWHAGDTNINYISSFITDCKSNTATQWNSYDDWSNLKLAEWTLPLSSSMNDGASPLTPTVMPDPMLEYKVIILTLTAIVAIATLAVVIAILTLNLRKRHKKIMGP